MAASIRGNILDAFFDSDRERGRATLTDLASNKDTNFEVISKVKDTVFSNPKGYNVFHFCIIPPSFSEGPALHRLQAIKAGVDVLGKPTESLLKALNAKCLDGGKTPLHLAAASISSERVYNMAVMLIQMGANPTICNNRGETPDQRALRGFGIDLRMHWGISKVPDINCYLSAKRYQLEGLSACFSEGNFDAAHQFLDNEPNFDVHKLDGEGNTTLLLAMRGGKVMKEVTDKSIKEDQILRMVQRLYSLNVNTNQMNDMDETVLSLAVTEGYCRIARFLLFDARVDTSKKTTRSGNTILHVAAEANVDQDIVELLLSSNARMEIRTSNSKGQLPLHLAKSHGVCRLFCKEDASLVNAIDKAKLTPKKHYAMLPDEDYREMCKILDAYNSEIPAREVPKTRTELGIDIASSLYSSVILEHAKDGANDVATTSIDAGVEVAKKGIEKKKKQAIDTISAPSSQDQ